MQWEKVFLFVEVAFDDCSCDHIKEGQFTINTHGQYLIDKQYLLNGLSI